MAVVTLKQFLKKDFLEKTVRNSAAVASCCAVKACSADLFAIKADSYCWLAAAWAADLCAKPVAKLRPKLAANNPDVAPAPNPPIAGNAAKHI